MEANRCGDNSLRCAVLDTNVLMYIYLKRIDVLTQLKDLGFSRIVVPKSVVSELKNLEKSLTGRERIAARFALRLIENGDIEVVETEAKRDLALIEVARRFNCYLITNDKSLRKRAKAVGIPYGYIRELNRVEIVE